MTELRTINAPAAGIFVRTGTVTARRLADALAWKTASGDVLRGEVGDWLVESQDGGRRTVKNAQFHSTYQQISGEVWQRAGQVAAWQSDRVMSLDTLEGEASVQPGDWVVTSPDGATWPVPDNVFRLSYRPLQ